MATLRSQYINLLLEYSNQLNMENEKKIYIESEIKHNMDLGNYYLQNLYNGYEAGAIYHIRQISSFKFLLNKIYYLTTENHVSIIDKIFLTFDKTLGENWLLVMGLTNIESHLETTILTTENYINRYAKI